MSGGQVASDKSRKQRRSEAEPSGGAFSRWRKMRRAKRDARALLKESKRILKKFKARLKPEIAEQIAEAQSQLVEARETNHYGKMRERAEKLDDILLKNVSFLRKSALREYAESIGIAVLIALLLRAFVVEAFKIPSGSMIPTLKIGDHIFVNKFTYGIKIPFTNIRLLPRKPERGDVIVFIYPRDEEKDFIKRIVAVGGDTVEVRNNQVYINDKPIKREKLSIKCQYTDGDESRKEFEIHPCFAYQESNGPNSYRVIQDINSFPVGAKKRKIPDDHVFVMGDNRDNSHDSRVWGTVPMSHIKGKALIIWWSSGAPEGVRWGRFFNLVHSLPAKTSPITP
ncbi:MAG: signal peptidase I [Myxococcales bacterium]|nr:signal peptidase I [Myxococcales bacterium]